MSEITLVTAYFDIGRGLWKKQERDNNKRIVLVKIFTCKKSSTRVHF